MTSKLSLSRRTAAIFTAAVLSFSALLPLITNNMAGALELPNRSVTIDKAYANASDVAWTFDFEWPTAQDREGLILRFCTAALGTCTAPTGMNVGSDTVTWDVGQTGFPTNGTDFAQYSGNLNACQETANATTELCFTRTADGSPSVLNDPASFTISGITAPSVNDTVYVRMAFYENETFDSPADADRGVVAAAFTNQLTVSATVSEYLEFCVGTVDADTSGDASDNCTDISGTTMNIGTIPFNAICYSALGTANNPCENDDGREGLAMVATNAAGGISISYYAEQDSSNGNNNKDGSLKIQGADCSATVGDSTDQCFESAGTVGIDFTAGTENFGMTVKSVVNPSYGGGDYTANGSLTSNLTRDAAYDGDGIADADTCTALDAGTDEDCWAWDESGAVNQIASSNTVIDDEMLVLNFAAAASLTTPTGTYAVTSTYIATPTF